MIRIILTLTMGCLLMSGLHAQTADSVSRNSAPRIFVDCQYGCDLQFVKNAITYVNFVRDRHEADIYVMLTEMETGGGGGQFGLYFIGEGQFAGQNDTLVYNAPAASTEGVVREALLAELKRGLLPYLLQTPLASKLTYSIDTDAANEAPEIVKDRWNNWVFSTRLNMNGSGQESYRSIYLNGFIRASKVLPEYKINASANVNTSINKYFLDTDTIINRQQSWGANVLYVKSLGEHWSTGVFADYYSSLFENINNSFALMPALEFDVYPYSEATRRQFRFLYRIGGRFNQYVEESIYGYQQEIRFRQHLEIGYEQVEKWGNISIEIDASHYLHNVQLNNVGINPNIEWNVFKGLNLNLSAYAELSRDQIFLPKGDATPEEVLLQIRQLKTGYSYFLYGGISYTFGSIYNNVVNPRFGR